MSSRTMLALAAMLIVCASTANAVGCVDVPRPAVPNRVAPSDPLVNALDHHR